MSLKYDIWKCVLWANILKTIYNFFYERHLDESKDKLPSAKSTSDILAYLSCTDYDIVFIYNTVIYSDHWLRRWHCPLFWCQIWLPPPHLFWPWRSSFGSSYGKGQNLQHNYRWTSQGVQYWLEVRQVSIPARYVNNIMEYHITMLFLSFPLIQFVKICLLMA